MRNPFARSSNFVLLGVALLLGAAPIFLSAEIPQAKPAPAEKPAVSAKKPKKSAKKSTRPRGQIAPTADRIKEIQGALAQKGFYEGAPSGKWDVRSVEAMKKFQEANSLSQTGKYDAKSLQKLGLGSDVAGAAAPRTSPDSTKPRPPLL